jgi:16S rRNA (uracil1498-N3)-methyltransferase
MTTRIFQAVALHPNSQLTLDAAASHHLARVLRARVGETIIIFNGEGGEYTATITTIDKKAVHLAIGIFTARECESPLDIWLAQGIARGEKMDYLLQKAVELGVKKIIPLITERGNVRLTADRNNKKWQHWQALVQSACEQCGRNRIPAIAAPQLFNHWLGEVDIADARAFELAPTAEQRLSDININRTARVILLIGPEGGLSDAEITAAQAKGLTALALGPRILRTETAAVAAVAALQTRFGDMG